MRTRSTLLVLAVAAASLVGVSSAQATAVRTINSDGSYDCYAASYGDEICGNITVPANATISGQVLTSDGGNDIKFTAKSSDGSNDYSSCATSVGSTCDIWTNQSGSPVEIQITTHSGAWTHGGRTTGKFSFHY